MSAQAQVVPFLAAVRRFGLGRLVVLAVASGCTPSRPESSATPSTAEATAARPAIAALRLVVVDDRPLAAAISRLKAEWKERTGGPLEIAEISDAEFEQSESLTADAIIYPSCRLGLLAAREWITPIPPELLAGKELAWSEVFDDLQLNEADWGLTPVAIPFGSPVLTCFYRRDLLEQVHREPPETWAQYHELAELLSHREKLGELVAADDSPWHAALEPLADGWRGRLLLARAAAYAKHRDNYSALFNIDNFEPLVAGPPFVRALTQLLAAAKLNGADAPRLDPQGVKQEFLAGHCGLALSWPSGPRTSQPAAAGPKLAIGFAELPGSEQMYDAATKAWDTRNADESRHVPLFAISGRLGSVAQSSLHPADAFRLLAWLSGTQWGARISSTSAATTLFRRSQMVAPQDWVDAGIDGSAAREYATVVERSFLRPAWVDALRIAGHDAYLAALDQAVEQALVGEASPQAALDKAAQSWREISQRLGRDKQRLAYRRSLRLDD